MVFVIAIVGLIALAIVSYVSAPDRAIERGASRGSWAPLEVGPSRRALRPLARA